MSTPTPSPVNPTPTPTTGTGTGFFITIAGLAFTPLNLNVPPGGTVTVVNNDSMPHSVTSEAVAGTYVPGSVGGVQFDTGIFSGGQRTFTIPANAVDKTVHPYFCRNHAGAMATPTGTITVDSSAQPAAAPSGGGTSPPPTGMPAPTPTY
jgi:plastocyanin